MRSKLQTGMENSRILNLLPSNYLLVNCAYDVAPYVSVCLYVCIYMGVSGVLLYTYIGMYIHIL